MGELMRPVATRDSGHSTRPFLRKSATVSAWITFLSTGEMRELCTKRKALPAVPEGPGRHRFSAAALWALCAEETGRE